MTTLDPATWVAAYLWLAGWMIIAVIIMVLLSLFKTWRGK